jgi:hypothetical protein
MEADIIFLGDSLKRLWQWLFHSTNIMLDIVHCLKYVRYTRHSRKHIHVQNSRTLEMRTIEYNVIEQKSCIKKKRRSQGN